MEVASTTRGEVIELLENLIALTNVDSACINVERITTTVSHIVKVTKNMHMLA